MDQQAFRQLLTTRRAEPAGGGQAYDCDIRQRAFHPSERRRATKEARRNAQEHAPRQTASTEFRGSHSRHAYMDRAEMRRRGIEMPLEARMPPSDHARETPETQITDADLDAAFEAGRTEKRDAPYPTAPRDAPAETSPEVPDVIYINGKRMRKKKKRSDPAVQSAPQEQAPKPPDAPRRKAAPEPPSAAPPKPDCATLHNRPTPDTPAPTKPAAHELEPAPPGDADTMHASRQPSEAHPSSHLSTHEPPRIASQPAARPAFVPAVDVDEDEDIFAGAPVWEGLSDEEEAKPPTAPRAPAHGGDWFASRAATATPPPLASPEHAEEEPTRSTRLEGLSTSALPSEMSRWLLERPDAPRRTDAAPRKRKRSKKGRGDIGSP